MKNTVFFLVIVFLISLIPFFAGCTNEINPVGFDKPEPNVVLRETYFSQVENSLVATVSIWNKSEVKAWKVRVTAQLDDVILVNDLPGTMPAWATQKVIFTFPGATAQDGSRVRFTINFKAYGY
ncbi:MAG: hypothetical protein AMQ22_00208 [Candidatus Methanofastidiosum methylothiophilum]|uniref:Uncharacterized protein n=1 Tax=Candidatus Methanofastidiosum methylothiophilum TaxID=1705564 RepID=A0A150IS50_9EURY|nr:MAG: hypothetical protein APG11_00834 [Candidatus Methanofastidiosum methylthiophilus]KYC53537.1 MAG: hypothetical protein AMQ22_00208 [Candidatus Methanofastidiosum methylthiophilus]